MRGNLNLQHGLWNILTNNMGHAHTDPGGGLNPCLECDEFTSGPGFQYAAEFRAHIRH